MGGGDVGDFATLMVSVIAQRKNDDNGIVARRALIIDESFHALQKLLMMRRVPV
jgi:hypothetical protein